MSSSSSPSGAAAAAAATAATAASETVSDPTFRAYTAEQAARYAASRSAYNPALYSLIASHHAATGGRTGTVLDVGCGPGLATRDLAALFDVAVGCDPGEQMVVQARRAAHKTRAGRDVVFEIEAAENIAALAGRDVGVAEGEVDMIACAMSAHWFDMEAFYAQAARLLRSGGSLAMWTQGSFYVNPSTTPNAEAAQAALTELETETLRPYTRRGNWLSYDGYETLEMPWQFGNEDLSRAFPADEKLRVVWNKGGRLEEGETTFFSGHGRMSLEEIRGALGTASMVTRWREANPDKVGTKEDCVESMLAKLRVAIGCAEGEDDEKVRLDVGMSTGLIVLKRR